MRSKILIAGLLAAMLAHTPLPASATPPDKREETAKALIAKLVKEDKATAAIIRVDRAVGGWTHSAGVRDLASGAPASPNGHFRIGSVTKLLVATVLLQLVDEKRLALTDPIERHLPGVVPQGTKISVRQILNHTSGLYDYMHEPGYSTNRWRGTARFRHYDPHDLLKVAFADPAKSTTPGAAWSYSNTNYVVAGLLVEKLTGRPYGQEIKRRILRPYGLTQTMIPGDKPGLPTPHARGYEAFPDGDLVDATRMNPSLDWAAGEMVSTGRDLNRFLAALAGGRILSSSSLAAMRTVQATDAGFGYGLGLQEYPLPCGAKAWGHSGELIGYLTFAFTSDDGTRMTLSVNPSRKPVTTSEIVAIATTAFC
ncbi:serine hydrolase domain-containing protein [Nonomuraea turcica]|uniref:serine hydrolase domain-containing protein n=1 Tax=Nonomuraea sp. G32 TaxID=3067274 RepID=UPI00273C9F5C|nr:serine hydrolase domain-containing protein [Nonomuraea sp. G32]MDP4505726.1 serine hydrolase domain-containing protein [Nonomuraea sp. G32]